MYKPGSHSKGRFGLFQQWMVCPQETSGGNLWFSGNYLTSHPPHLPKDAPQTMEIILAAIQYLQFSADHSIFSYLEDISWLFIVVFMEPGPWNSFGEKNNLQIFFPSWVNPGWKSSSPELQVRDKWEWRTPIFLLQRFSPRL